jgi:Mrp family chromosome partitioning ATPase
VPAYPIEVATWDAAAVSPASEAMVTANVGSWSKPPQTSDASSPREQPPAEAKREQASEVAEAADAQPAAPTKKVAKPVHAPPPQPEEVTPAGPPLKQKKLPVRPRSEEAAPTSATAEPQTATPTHDVPPPASAPAPPEPEEAPAGPPFKAVWEVDRFVWPPDVNRLYEAESNYFSYAGEKLREAAKEGLRVLVVGSAQPGEGCTTLALCLARAAADTGMKVALLEANLDRPQLASRMGLKFVHGWQEALTGAVTLGETAVTSLEHAVCLLPAALGAQPIRLNDPRVSQLLRDITAATDLVIVDLGPVGEQDEGCFEAGENCPADAAIVVRDMRRTSERQTLRAALHLKTLGVDAVGIAENYTPRAKGTRKAA